MTQKHALLRHRTTQTPSTTIHPAMSAAPAGAEAARPKTPPRSPSRSPAATPPPYTEQTPLLASQADDEPRDQHEDAALLEPPQAETRRSKSWWFWRVLWAVLAVLLLAVFIKGWVDAKDVDVSLGLRLTWLRWLSLLLTTNICLYLVV